MATSRRGMRWCFVVLLGVGAAALLCVRTIRRLDPEAAYEQTLGALEAGRINAAEAGLSRLSLLRAPTVLDWGLRARVAIARERTSEALAALARIPDEHPLAAWARLRAGQLELRRRRFRAAETSLRQALKRKPDYHEARRELVYILGVQLRRQELDEQCTHLAHAGALSAHEVWVWCMSRDLVWWTPEEHVAILEAALAADPDDRWSRLALAATRRRQGRYDVAESLLRPLPRSDPDACAARAEIALERDDPDTAAAVLAAGPDDHPTLAALRGRLALGRGDGAQAVRHLKRAEAAEPGRRRTTADLGHAYLRLGAVDQAKPYRETARRIDALHNLLLKAEPQTKEIDPELWRRLGLACEDAGRAEQARAWFRVVLAANPLDATAQQALYRLKSRSPRPREAQSFSVETRSEQPRPTTAALPAPELAR